MLTSRQQKRSNTQDQTTTLKAQPVASHVLERWPRLLTVPQLPGQRCELESRCPNTGACADVPLCRGFAFGPPCDILLHASPGWCFVAGSRGATMDSWMCFPISSFLELPRSLPYKLEESLPPCSMFLLYSTRHHHAQLAHTPTPPPGTPPARPLKPLYLFRSHSPERRPSNTHTATHRSQLVWAT